jgi:hypothetical protein
MTTTYHTAIVNGDARGNDAAIWNGPFGTLDAQLVTQAAQIATLNTSGVGSVYAQINNGAGEADTSWVVDNISGTFLAGAQVVFTVSGVVYSATVAANTSTTPLTVTGAPAVTIPDNTVIAQVPAGVVGRVLESVRNVVDPAFGADATGATDSRTAINTAVASAAAGETVYFPKGTYDLGTGDITIPDGVILRGDGATISVDSGVRCFTVGSNVQIHGLKFDGNNDLTSGAHTGSNNASVLTDSGQAWAIDAFVGKTITNITDGSTGTITANTATTITATLAGGTDNDFDTGDRYVISNTTSRFFLILDETNVLIRDCEFSDMANNALSILGSTQITVENCRFRNLRQANGITGITIGGNDADTVASSIVNVVGCLFKNDSVAGYGAAGIIIIGDSTADLQVTYANVDRCYFENMGRADGPVGVAPRGDIDVYNDVKHCKFTNCTSINSLHSFIKANDGSDILIQGNTVIGAAVQGIVWNTREWNTRNEDIRVIGNYVESSGSDGIEVKGSTEGTDPANYALRVIVSGNHIVNPGALGIDVSEALGVTIAHNDVYNPGAAGIQFANDADVAKANVRVIGNAVDMNGAAFSGIIVNSKESGQQGATIVNSNVVANNTVAAGISVLNAISPIINGNKFDTVASSYSTTGSVTPVIDGRASQSATIATGAITVANDNITYIIVDTESAAATDDLATISGGLTGQMITLESTNNARDITLKDATGNLQLAGDFTLDRTTDTITLIYNGSSWREVARSNNLT